MIEHITVAVLALVVVFLLIVNGRTLQLAQEWHDYAQVAQSNFERCRKALPVPPPGPGAMITSGKF